MSNDNMPNTGQKKQTLEDKLNELQQRHKKIEGQIKAQIKDRNAREKEKLRKIDTRKKIIIGALAQNHMQKNPHSEFAKKLENLINEYVVKDVERNYFDLPPLPEQKQKNRIKN